MYLLNGAEITEEYAEALINDLAQFPVNVNDFALRIEERAASYKTMLEAGETIHLSSSLILSKK